MTAEKALERIHEEIENEVCRLATVCLGVGDPDRRRLLELKSMAFDLEEVISRRAESRAV